MTAQRPAPAKPARPARPAWHWVLLALATVVGAFLVVRAIVELATVHYGDPASYARDWGGPTLAGVLAVHAGPGAVSVAVAAVAWRRRRRAGA
jgi:hypothetical protein